MDTLRQRVITLLHQFNELIEAHTHRSRDLGCEMAQGFFFGRPQSADDITALLKKVSPDVESHPHLAW